jgi:uncharacterized protein (DUF58 family)
MTPKLRHRGLIGLGGRRRAETSPPSPTATPVRKKPSVDFSLTGMLYASTMMFMGLAAVNSQANLLFGVFGLMLGVLAFSFLLGRVTLRRLSVKRSLPEVAIVGEPAMIQYQFENKKRFWPSVAVSVAELEGSEAFTAQPQAYMLHAGPGKTTVVPLEVIPKRRGLHKLGGYQLITSFPFGFLRRAWTGVEEEEILIYPAIGKVSPRLLAMCLAAEQGGANIKPRRNGTDEFYGVKEFREGENPRWIYWKRSARTGTLISKEMFHVSPPRLLIIVDTYLEQDTPEQRIAIEKTLAMAATMANTALESGLAVGMCGWANGWKTVPEQRGKRHCRDILAALADLPLNRTTPPDWLLQRAAPLLKDGVTPVFFTPRNVNQSLGELARGGMLTVCAESEQANGWFKFDPKVDFSRSMPASQEPAPKVAVSKAE